VIAGRLGHFLCLDAFQNRDTTDGPWPGTNLVSHPHSLHDENYTYAEPFKLNHDYGARPYRIAHRKIAEAVDDAAVYAKKQSPSVDEPWRGVSVCRA